MYKVYGLGESSNRKADEFKEPVEINLKSALGISYPAVFMVRVSVLFALFYVYVVFSLLKI